MKPTVLQPKRLMAGHHGGATMAAECDNTERGGDVTTIELLFASKITYHGSNSQRLNSIITKKRKENKAFLYGFPFISTCQQSVIQKYEILHPLLTFHVNVNKLCFSTFNEKQADLQHQPKTHCNRNAKDAI